MLTKKQISKKKKYQKALRSLEKYNLSLLEFISQSSGEEHEAFIEMQRTLLAHQEKLKSELLCLNTSAITLKNLHYVKNFEELDAKYNKSPPKVKVESTEELEREFQFEQDSALKRLEYASRDAKIFINELSSTLIKYNKYVEALNEDETNNSSYDPFATSNTASGQLEEFHHAADRTIKTPALEPIKSKLKFIKKHGESVKLIQEQAKRAVDSEVKHAASVVPFIHEFGSANIKELYRNENPGANRFQSFLKFCNIGVRGSRASQLESLENAIRTYTNNIHHYITAHPEESLENPESVQNIGKELLVTSIGKVLSEIQQEKEHDTYKLGESRLESICKKMCSSIGITTEEALESVSLSGKAIVPKVAHPKANKPGS